VMSTVARVGPTFLTIARTSRIALLFPMMFSR
jgi:hypothetical protein